MSAEKQDSLYLKQLHEETNQLNSAVDLEHG